MTLVRIIKDWDWPDLMRQTPAGKGIWDGIQFTLERAGKCDYVIILNRALEDITLRCPPEHVWAIMQEPPNEYYAPFHIGNNSYHRIYTSDIHLKDKKYVYSQPALPWHVNKDYDFLISCSVPKKDRNISWITSNKVNFQGQRDRLAFLETIGGKLQFDLFGKGFSYVEDKWEALAPYRYSLVVENFRNPYYWSEKLADCFLSWTFPIYFGCSRITEYFPQDALAQIDIYDPYAFERIREVVSSDLWRKNQEAIEQARKMVLNTYQLFPFVTQEIRKHQRTACGESHIPQIVTIPHQSRSPMAAEKWFYVFARAPIGRFLKKLKTRLFHSAAQPLTDGNGLSSLSIRTLEHQRKSYKSGLRAWKR